MGRGVVRALSPSFRTSLSSSLCSIVDESLSGLGLSPYRGFTFLFQVVHRQPAVCSDSGSGCQRNTPALPERHRGQSVGSEADLTHG